MTFVLGMCAGYLICWVALRGHRRSVMRFYESAKECSGVSKTNRRIALANFEQAEQARLKAIKMHEASLEAERASRRWAELAEESGRRADEVWAAAREELAKARAIVGEQTS